MMRRQVAHAAVFVCLAGGLLPGAASAQSQITGVVTDSSGGVLPGVTVEVADPGAHREDAHGGHGRGRTVCNRGSSSWHVPGELHLARVF